MSEAMTIDHFANRVGEAFALQDGHAGHELVLTSCEQLGGDAPGRVPFSLLFRGAGGAVLPQRAYTVRHDGLGTFELFIVPVGRDGDGTVYEAVFS